MALFFAVLLGISAAVLAYFILAFNQASLIREVEMGFDADISAVQDWYELSPFMELTEIIDRMDRNHPTTYFSIQDPAGDYVYGDFHPEELEISVLKEGIVMMDVESQDVSSISFDGTRRFAAKVHALPDGTRLLMARDVNDALKNRNRLQLLGLLTILLMLIVIVTSFLISTVVVARLNTIWRTARSIVETGDLSQRIDVKTQWDDLSTLAQVLNELLERIEGLMQSVRQVSDNIAHDLRTPLTRLRSHMDELDHFLKTTGNDDGHEIAESLIGEADQILRTFNALLRIARIESGKMEQEFAEVDLSEVLMDVLDLYQPVAEEKNIHVLDLQTESKTIGDRDMLFQLFANLMDNAVKFTPEGGTVRVLTEEHEGEIQVRIEDTGPGISEEDQKHIFDRFFRAEESRSSPGAGLGLSLVYAVLQLHQGRVEVHENNPGTCFCIYLKALQK